MKKIGDEMSSTKTTTHDSGIILGIETSCDETAAALVADGRSVCSNIVSSQVKFHEKFGGVVPEIASRKHLEHINMVVAEALSQGGVALDKLSGVAVTRGPGLVGALVVGLATAKAIAFVTGLPLIGVNHIEGHIYANFLEHPDCKPPLVGLVISGGHTMIVHMVDYGCYEIMGETLDDAAGEAFDKIAGFLGLGYPGGPIIDKLARRGNQEAVSFPRAMMGRKDFDFSFSGLKTAVLYHCSQLREAGAEIPVEDIAASFEAALVEVVVSKLLRAAQEKGVPRIFISGGVAANQSLRRQAAHGAKKHGLELFCPSPPMCTDNAAMVAAAGYYSWRRGETMGLEAAADASMGLSPM